MQVRFFALDCVESSAFENLQFIKERVGRMRTPSRLGNMSFGAGMGGMSA